MCFTNKFQSNCMSFKFSFDNSHLQSFIFWSSIRGTQHAQTFFINRCSRKIVLTEPVHAHSVGYQLHIDSTILQYSIFNSTTVFFADSFRRTSRPELIFKADSALTKLCCPALDRGIWRCTFTVYNRHSIVYLLQRNVLQCSKFYHWTITDFVKISHSVKPTAPRLFGQESRTYLLYNSRDMANFLLKFSNFRYHGNRGRLSQVWITPLNWPLPKTP